jgi:2-dehydro-3-deoxyphosphogluconate aldolase/(4S)-4-hydroxy-2-oxoglutarate aldolase
MIPPRLADVLQDTGVIAVLVIERVADAVPLARALLDGGVNVMELTLRTPVAMDALRAIRAEVPTMLAGIGTILTVQQVREVANAGAAFGVAPGTNRRVLEAARSCGLPFAPGIVTPSDIEAAVEAGCRLLKFFPAEPSGGLNYLNSIAAPFAHLGLRYVPLGGVQLDNMLQYLKNPHVLAVGGSWLAPRELIAEGQWSAITERAAAARRKIVEMRSCAAPQDHAR